MSGITWTADMLRDTIIARWLEVGHDLTVREIAVYIGKNDSFVRRQFAKHGGSLPGLQATRESRPSRSLDYPMFRSGGHRVWVYGPTRQTLRDRILKERSRSR